MTLILIVTLTYAVVVVVKMTLMEILTFVERPTSLGSSPEQERRTLTLL